MSYDSFKKNKSKILIATDVFGRGIDIDRVNLIINLGNFSDMKTFLMIKKLIFTE